MSLGEQKNVSSKHKFLHFLVDGVNEQQDSSWVIITEQVWVSESPSALCDPQWAS